MRDHTGDLSLNTVSGELAASGALTRVQANSVSGELALDVTSGSTSIEATSVSGDVTVRLPEGEARATSRPTPSRGGWSSTARTTAGTCPAARSMLRTGDASSHVSASTVSGNVTLLRGRAAPCQRRRPAAGPGRAGRSEMPPVFAHGQLRLYLLALLEQRPMHGYEVITALSDRFGGTYRPSAGTIYPRLAQLEEDGLVRRTDVDRRSTYELTDAGRRELEERRGELAALEQGIAETVRDRAARVRDDVRGTMSGLRAELAAAAQEARAAAPPHTGANRDRAVDLARAVHRGRRPAAPLPRRGARRAAPGRRRRPARGPHRRDAAHGARLGPVGGAPDGALRPEGGSVLPVGWQWTGCTGGPCPAAGGGWADCAGDPTGIRPVPRRPAAPLRDRAVRPRRHAGRHHPAHRRLLPARLPHRARRGGRRRPAPAPGSAGRCCRRCSRRAPSTATSSTASTASGTWPTPPG